MSFQRIRLLLSYWRNERTTSWYRCPGTAPLAQGRKSDHAPGRAPLPQQSGPDAVWRQLQFRLESSAGTRSDRSILPSSTNELHSATRALSLLSSGTLVAPAGTSCTRSPPVRSVANRQRVHLTDRALHATAFLLRGGEGWKGTNEKGQARNQSAAPTCVTHFATSVLPKNSSQRCCVPLIRRRFGSVPLSHFDLQS